MMLFGALVLSVLGGYFLKIPVLSSALVFMILYVWSRRNPETPMNFFGFRFKGFYIPWVMLAFSVLIGNSPVMDLLGIAAGHLYFFLQDVLPETSGALGGTRLLITPRFMCVATALYLFLWCSIISFLSLVHLPLCVSPPPRLLPVRYDLVGEQPAPPAGAPPGAFPAPGRVPQPMWGQGQRLG